jgi:restriction endonuclease S subunit
VVQLADITDLKVGFPGQPEKEGQLLFFQVRQFNEDGQLIYNGIDAIVLDEKTKPHILRGGDVLFVGKGNRLFAWCYQPTDTPAIASSSFFVLRPKSTKIDSGYLAAILNAPQTKAVFQQIGGGTNIFSIRKSELGALQIPLPHLDKQKKIAAIAQLHQKEMELAKSLMSKKQELYTSIISKLIK